MIGLRGMKNIVTGVIYSSSKITIPFIFVTMLFFSSFTSYTLPKTYDIVYWLRYLMPPLLFILVLMYIFTSTGGKLYINKYAIVALLYIIWINITFLFDTSETKLWILKANCAFSYAFFSIFVLDKKHIKILGWILVSIAVLNSFVVLFAWLLNVGSITSFIADRNMFSRFQAIAHVFLLIQWIKSSKKLNWFVIPLFLIMLSMIPQQSRSGLLLYLIGTGLVIFYTRNKKIIFLSIFLSGLLILPFAVQLNKRSNTTVVNFSDLGRLSAAAAGVNMIKDKPVTGVGYYRSYYLFDEYQNKDLPGLYGMDTIHTVLLAVWADTGIIGLFLFAFFNWGITLHLYRAYIRHKKPFETNTDALFAFIAIFLYQLHGLVYHDTNFESFYWYTITYGILVMKRSE